MAKAKKGNVVKLLRFDDWDVLVVNRKVYVEGHCLGAEEVLEYVSDVGTFEFEEKEFDFNGDKYGDTRRYEKWLKGIRSKYITAE